LHRWCRAIPGKQNNAITSNGSEEAQRGGHDLQCTLPPPLILTERNHTLSSNTNFNTTQATEAQMLKELGISNPKGESISKTETATLLSKRLKKILKQKGTPSFTQFLYDYIRHEVHTGDCTFFFGGAGKWSSGRGE
jgi:hypothetical protein